MRLGLKYPDRFSSIWAHSSAFHFGNLAGSDFLSDPADAQLNPHADKVVKSGHRPVISFDCGVDDERLKFNRDFDAHLNKIGLDHTYVEYPGAHTWDYWDEHTVVALNQHSRVLGVEQTQ